MVLLLLSTGQWSRKTWVKWACPTMPNFWKAHARADGILTGLVGENTVKSVGSVRGLKEGKPLTVIFPASPA